MPVAAQDPITAWVSEVPGALRQGRTREEARANVIDAQAASELRTESRYGVQAA